jgi:hypothetical protein
MEAKIRASL